MATIGRIGSFATTEAPQDYISGALQNVENQSFRYRAERRLAEEEKQKAEEEKQQGIVADLGSINLKETTPYESHNAFAIDGANKLYGYTADLARKYSEGKISKVEYEIGKKNAMNQIQLMNDANKRINEQVKGYSKLVGEGKIASGFEQNALRLGGAYDNVRMKWELTPQGTLEAIAYDEDGTIIERGGLDKFGNNAFTPVLDYDFDKDKKEFITTYPKVTNEKFQGMSIVTTKGITPQIKEAIDLKVDAIIKNPNALAIKAAELTGKPNPNVNNPEIIEKVKQNLKKEYEALYSEDKEVKEATGRYNATKPTKGDKEDKPITLNNEPIFVTKTGVKPGTNLKLEEDNIGYSFGNATIKQEGAKAKTAKGIYVNPTTGKVKLWVEERGYTTVSEDKSELTASGKAKLEREKKKLGTEFNYNTFINSGVLEPSDYSSQKTSTKDTQERFIDLDTQAGQAMEYADLLGVSVGDLKSMYLEQARRDKSKRLTSNKQKVDEYGVPIN